MARLEGEVGKLKQEAAQAWKNRDNASTKAHQTLTKLKELKSKMEKEQNNKGVDKERLIQQLQKRVLALTDQN